jgi:hypothetical protein
VVKRRSFGVTERGSGGEFHSLITDHHSPVWLERYRFSLNLGAQITIHHSLRTGAPPAHSIHDSLITIHFLPATTRAFVLAIERYPPLMVSEFEEEFSKQPSVLIISAI